MKQLTFRFMVTALMLTSTSLLCAQTAQPLPVLQGTVGDVRNINTASLLTLMAQGSANRDLVLVAAHRGYWLNAPENSAPALQGAFDSGIEAIEIDLRTTSDGQLVLSHDPDLVKETTGTGLISNTPYSLIQGLPLRDRKGRPNSGLHMLTFADALAILQSYSSGGNGPVIIADLKDPNPWPAYQAGVNQVKARLAPVTQPAVVFKMKMKNLPSVDQIEQEFANHPSYGHILPVVNPEDAQGTWAPNTNNFNDLLVLSQYPYFVQQFELNINAVGDGASQYVSTGASGVLFSFATYWEPRFYPEGVSTISFDSNNQPFTRCCYLPSSIPADLRGVLNFSLYYNSNASPGVSLITSDNLAETLNFLSSLGLRNTSELQ